MWTFFSLALVGVVICIFALLRRYAAPSVPLVVKATTAYAWLVAFIVVVLVPIDVYSTLSNVAYNGEVDVMWKTCFWSTQVLTWLVLPFFQVYADAGDFTVGARCLTSLKENGILYGVAGAAGVVGLVVILVVEKTLKLADLMAIGMGMSNTFALSVGLLLMGFGLVEIPREAWKSAPEQRLKWLAHRTGRFASEVLRTTAELEAVVTIICANEKQMPRRDPLRPYMEIIAAFAEAESPVKPSQVSGRTLDIERLTSDDLEYNYDKAGLAALRRRLAAAIHNYKGAHAQYEEVVTQALVLQDIVKSRERGVYEAPPGTLGAGKAWGRVIWQYRCAWHPYVRKVVSVLLAALSLVIIWSEATIFTKQDPDLSPFSMAVRAAVSSEWGVQLLTSLPLAYICVCTYFALFRVTAFDYNKLLPRATTGAALMQNGSLMCRFGPATCWNLLHMIHMDAGVDGRLTVFTKNMGTMDVLPVLGKHLNVYLPVLLVVHCALIYLRLWDRLTSSCVNSKYRFNSDDVDDQFTEQGRGLLRKELEAAANGLRIGGVLHSSAIEMEFPGLGPAKKPARKKSWFSFSRSPAAADGASGARSAASGRAERAPLFGGARSDAEGAAAAGGGGGGGSGNGGLLSSLIKNKYATSSSPLAADADGVRAGSQIGSSPHGGGGSSDGGGAPPGGGGGRGGGGLDGIFAEISSRPARGGGSAGAANRRPPQS